MPKKKKTAASSGERRKDSRLKEEDKVVVELLTDGRPPSDKTVTNALTKDVSPGGARLLTNIFLPVNTPLKLEIVLPQRGVIHAVGVVRWISGMYEEELFEAGIEFTQISPHDKMLLLEHTYSKKD